MLAMLALLLAASPASAQDFNPFEVGCVLTGDSPVSLAQAEARAGEFDCRPHPSDVEAAHAWLRLPGTALDRLPAVPLVLESDIAPIGAMTVAIRYADGRREVRRYDARSVADHWTPGARFSVPLTDDVRGIDSILVGVDRPWSRATVTTMEVLPKVMAEQQRDSRTILFSIFCGLLIVPILYSSAFFVVLRYRFMLYHALMAAFVGGFTFCSSNLVMHFFPGTDLWGRLIGSYASLSLAAALAGFFIIGFIEPGHVTAKMRRYAYAASWLLIVNALYIATLGPDMPFVARNIYHAAYIPAVLVFFYVGWHALRQGSRAAWFILAGWWVTILLAFDRIFRGLDFYILPTELDYWLYLALTIEAMVTAFGVAYRVTDLRRERDLAVARETELRQLADTDGLTSLPNRRAFDAAWNGRQGGALAIIDLDYFKSINDRFGHQIGDEVLREAGKLLRDVEGKGYCRKAYRLGGEEFAVLFDAKTPEDAMIRADAIRMTFIVTIEKAVRALDEAVTVSIGLAMIDGRSADQVYAAADAALYQAKERGRDRVVMEDAPSRPVRRGRSGRRGAA